MDIIFKEVEHRYQVNTPFERIALHDLNLNIQSGTFLAVIGHTGSGKSTIIQHLNALLKPTAGEIQIGERTIKANRKEKNLKAIRQQVGVVFQFPEHQLFEETVEKDIAFGPMNYGVSEEEAKQKARELIKLVGLPEDILARSPFDLSGGQMRRVAIAGILAMNPNVLILDEPTAGLDPRGRQEIMNMIYRLHKEKGLTTILVTHSMEDAAMYADELIVMNKGTIAMKGSPREVFGQHTQLKEYGLDVPESLRFMLKLQEKFQLEASDTVITFSEVVEKVQHLMQQGERL
ncbi:MULTISPECIES: energy-coupling factor ABC transporter ATP-binding protein [Priestia]|jgi:energy-coupling factor transport system ATP-binding protein|uniref:Energy-coupling factor transporter ATP-binding protein EcfA2 n=2 Tax=Priestia megaterium TaxID=1404 RepID=D5D9T4_PRIM3|nr:MULTISPECIES: energy-coupling factor ABC transporter ATP-binding protein [Priestia]KRE06627.1 energy-coupling factor transporter ATPase [Bacillus sp. Root239]TCN05659.1 energy-coupling factor transport system ATP-binding protein [Bacillus sp. BK006]ADF37104.1 cobalt import ABC transporter, ATP-binding protein CbiO2 [Priestia megaterium DSM 319]AJI22474.1 ABC transporter family protein [Priestia megaterium NBRC 15308 = ATCC 14581]AYE48353.1 energy-coupling factor ABC transporter ATP-binding 